MTIFTPAHVHTCNRRAVPAGTLASICHLVFYEVFVEKCFAFVLLSLFCMHKHCMECDFHIVFFLLLDLLFLCVYELIGILLILFHFNFLFFSYTCPVHSPIVDERTEIKQFSQWYGTKCQRMEPLLHWNNHVCQILPIFIENTALATSEWLSQLLCYSKNSSYSYSDTRWGWKKAQHQQ